MSRAYRGEGLSSLPEATHHGKSGSSMDQKGRTMCHLK
jgi:hypothetical protein